MSIMYNTSDNVTSQMMADAIIRHITSIANDNRIYNCLFMDVSYNGWRNAVLDQLIDTGLETIEVWSAHRRVPPITLLSEAVAVISDIQSFLSAQRTPEVINTLTPSEKQSLAAITAIGNQLDAEITDYRRKAQGGNRYVSPFSQTGSHGTKPSTNPRYANVAASTPVRQTTDPTVSTSPTNQSTRYRASSPTRAVEQPKQSTSKDGRIYVTNHNASSPMSESETLVYSNHRRQTFNALPSDRKPEPDFMGALADDRSIVYGENTVSLDEPQDDGPSVKFVATCRKHAQALAGVTVVDSGGEVSLDAVFEYEYEELTCLRTMVDDDTLRLAIINDQRLNDLRDVDNDLSALASGLSDILNGNSSDIVKIVARRMNRIATAQVMRLLKYDFELTWEIADFQNDWDVLLAELIKDFGENKINPALEKCASDIISKVQVAFTPDTEGNPEYCNYIDRIFNARLAGRSVFTTETIHVTHIPATVSHMKLSFENNVAFVDPVITPELYTALSSLEKRMDGKMRTYSKVLMITEDEVELEIIPTYIKSTNDQSKLLYAINVIGW